MRWVQLCGSLSILWDCLSLGLEWKLTFSSPVATAEFSREQLWRQEQAIYLSRNNFENHQFVGGNKDLRLEEPMKGVSTDGSILHSVSYCRFLPTPSSSWIPVWVFQFSSRLTILRQHHILQVKSLILQEYSCPHFRCQSQAQVVICVSDPPAID